MISGQQALGGMSQTLSRERTALDNLEMQTRALQERIEALHQQDLDDLRALAKLRLDDISAGEVVGRLTRAEAKAKKVLQERATQQSERDREIKEANATLDALFETRTANLAKIDDHEAAIEAADAKTRKKLAKDAGYVAQEEAARRADIQAANARDKADQSESELAEKGLAYTNSRIFMYLWNRKYGLAGYRAFPLIRYLDGRVASLIDYTDARLNYARLTELPVRLGEHADRLEEASDAQDADLDALWVAARKGDGSDKLDAALAAAEEDAAATDTLIEAAQAALEGLHVQRHTATETAGREAIEILSEALQRKDIDDLWDDARETLNREDDDIVERMLDREEDRERIEDQIHDLSRKFERRHDRLDDFGGMLGEFQRKFTKTSSGFLDGALIASLAEEFLEGILDADDWWEEIGKQHRRRRSSSSARSPWKSSKRKRKKSWPSGGSSWSGGRSGSRGGFRTGGGFGGGGFRTGGGI